MIILQIKKVLNALQYTVRHFPLLESHMKNYTSSCNSVHSKFKHMLQKNHQNEYTSCKITKCNNHALSIIVIYQYQLGVVNILRI